MGFRRFKNIHCKGAFRRLDDAQLEKAILHAYSSAHAFRSESQGVSNQKSRLKKVLRRIALRLG
jgi:hypothetical protein